MATVEQLKQQPNQEKSAPSGKSLFGTFRSFIPDIPEDIPAFIPIGLASFVPLTQTLLLPSELAYVRRFNALRRNQEASLRHAVDVAARSGQLRDELTTKRVDLVALTEQRINEIAGRRNQISSQTKQVFWTALRANRAVFRAQPRFAFSSFISKEAAKLSVPRYVSPSSPNPLYTSRGPSASEVLTSSARFKSAARRR